MTFQAPKVIPGLDAEPNREIIKSLNQIELDLGVIEASQNVTPVKTSDYTAQIGELVLVIPPAAGMRVLVPAGTAANQTQRVLIAVLNVTSGGTVTVLVVGGTQKINNTASLSLTTAGLTELASTGTSGWSAQGNGASGGGGGGSQTWASTLGFGNTSGANNPFIDAGQFLNLGLAGPLTNSPQITCGDATFRIRGGGNTAVFADGGIAQLAASTTIIVATAGVTRLQITPAGEWAIPTGGALGFVLTHQGAGTPPVWAAAAGGGTDPRIFAWFGV